MNRIKPVIFSVNYTPTPKGGSAMVGKFHPPFPPWVTFFLPVLSMIFWCGCGTQISDIQARNQTEREILSLLTVYQEAKNDRDMENLMVLLHPAGEFSYACGIMVSKAELAEMLPAFWAKLDNELLKTVPMAHECLNGDYYTTGILRDPEIIVSGNRANVKVWFTRPLWSSLLQFFNLVREEGNWRITRTWWGPS